MWFEKSNFWRIPLWKNAEMFEDLAGLINAEMISERLLGDILKRD
jgi:hypothetical protein